MLTNKEKWTVLKSLFDEKGLVRQHLDSYNDFIEVKMQEIVDESGEVVPDIPGFKIKFGKIHVGKPKVREADGATMEITPIEARIRELSYAADITLEMTPITIDERTQREEEEKTLPIYIGKLPIMLKSCRCPLESLSEPELVNRSEDPLDPGGYFIINGTERVLVTQEDLAPNRILAEEASRSSSATHQA
ncbi:MAG: DNA-directed RNA polymerase subunit B, partial [Promethearchaeia archaeon]